MRRLAQREPLPISTFQICNSLMDSEGTCVCGQVLCSLDAKLILMTAVPSTGQMVIAAYCLRCSLRINKALKLCRGVMHTGTVTAPVERIK